MEGLFDGAPDQRQRCIAPVRRAAAHVVYRAEHLQVLRLCQGRQATGRALPEKFLLQGAQALRHLGAGAHGNASVADDAIRVGINEYGNHGNRDHQIASVAELDKARACALALAPWHQDGCDQFPGQTRDAPVAKYKFSQRHTAPARERGQFDLCLQRQQHRNAIRRGRCIADVAGQRAHVLHLDATDVARGLLQTTKLCRQGGARDLAPGHSRADTPLCAFFLQGLQLGQRGDVQHRFGDGLPAARGIEVGAPGQNRQRLLRQSGQGFIQALRPKINAGRAGQFGCLSDGNRTC